MKQKKLLKFGGTSVGSPEALRKMLEIIRSEKTTNEINAVVVSAFSGVTDKLINAAVTALKPSTSFEEKHAEIQQLHIDIVEQLIPPVKRARVLAEVKTVLSEFEVLLRGIHILQELSQRTLDLASSFGERLSAFIISEFFSAEGLPSEFLDARKIVFTNDQYGNARVDAAKTYPQIKEYFANHEKLQVVTGFIGTTATNDTTTLGRGGSDYSASIFGAALGVAVIEIWTDVDGILTADPRKVDQSFSIPQLSYEEAMELSHFGAKVIYPPTMVPAMQESIPIVIRNTFNPGFPGSTIGNLSAPANYVVTGISSISEVALLRVQGSGMVGIAGVATRLFGALAKEFINVILITQASSEHTVCFAVARKDGERAKKAVEKEFKHELAEKLVEEIVVEKNTSIIAVVGGNMRKIPGISGRLFRALGKNGINVIAIAQGSSELNISVVISEADEGKALRVVHDEFFLSDTRTLHVFLAGTGVVGQELLKQISKNRDRLKTDYAIDIRLSGVLNTRGMQIKVKGLEKKSWEELISAPKEQHLESNISSFPEFIARMKSENLPSCVFVDCTASTEICEHYSDIISSGISIVSANKKSLTGNYLTYEKLKSQSKGRFLFETCVGAGLPVISTLNDLTKSGDEIIKIEAVLSGTLSFIFNKFSSKTPFSSLVKEAKQNGYTEPDPREDLNGKDVGRKLLILARESGIKLEPGDIEVEDLTPKELRDIKSVNEFFEKLPSFDENFNSTREKAEKRSEKLVYLAVIENNKAKAHLTSVSDQHPFYRLSGRDNIIAFTSARYKERALVVQGPGAGAEVTAAGVYADIIRLISNS